MTDDDITRRLTNMLHAEAARVTAPTDALDRYKSADGNITAIRPTRAPTFWLGVPTALVGVAAAIALVVMVVRPGGSSSTQVRTHAALSAPAQAPLVPGLAPGTGAAAASPGAAAGTANAPSASAGTNGATSAGSSGASIPAAGAPAFGTAPRPPTPPTPPTGFRPVSVTFVSPSDGWVLGNYPCSGTACAAVFGAFVLHTTDGGATWGSPQHIAAALTTDGASGQPNGISELRFADSKDGWAFGPGLWATHDGGATWHQVNLPGGESNTATAQVSDLEASAGFVRAAVLEDDTSVAVGLYSSPVGSDAFTRSNVTVPIGAGPVPHAQIVLHGTSGWMIENDRVVIGGARLVNGAWHSWTPPCATVVGPAVLAASSSNDLIAACDVGLWSTPQGEQLYASHDGGSTFAKVAGIPFPASGIAAANSTTYAATDGVTIYLTSNAGHSWASVDKAGATMISDLGFTTATQGVAIATDGSTAQLLMTRDGGRVWGPVTL